jgi:hypothetical protein
VFLVALDLTEDPGPPSMEVDLFWLPLAMLLGFALLLVLIFG